MGNYSLRQQLMAVDAAVRMMQSGIKPTSSEREYLATILVAVRKRIEASIEREGGNVKR